MAQIARLREWNEGDISAGIQEEKLSRVYKILFAVTSEWCPDYFLYGDYIKKMNVELSGKAGAEKSVNMEFGENFDGINAKTCPSLVSLKIHLNKR